ncbi:hypothetical protein CBM2600_B10601 [Cupriavidus taiwanensis]|nr:hypothetical protein CBM2600_B10601 [Cupriavidus taiwanensis]
MQRSTDSGRRQRRLANAHVQQVRSCGSGPKADGRQCPSVEGSQKSTVLAPPSRHLDWTLPAWLPVSGPEVTTLSGDVGNGIAQCSLMLLQE